VTIAPIRRRMLEGHERRRRGMVPVCVRGDLINLACQRTLAERRFEGLDVVFAEHRPCGFHPSASHQLEPNTHEEGKAQFIEPLRTESLPNDRERGRCALR
jgi:hypothetical protein